MDGPPREGQPPPAPGESAYASFDHRHPVLRDGVQAVLPMPTQGLGKLLIHQLPRDQLHGDDGTIDRHLELGPALISGATDNPLGTRSPNAGRPLASMLDSDNLAINLNRRFLGRRGKERQQEG